MARDSMKREVYLQWKLNLRAYDLQSIVLLVIMLPLILHVIIGFHKHYHYFSGVVGNLLNTLSYESSVSEILVTDDGSNLDADCTRRYLNEAEVKTSFMSKEIQHELADLGCDDIVTAVTHVESFTALGSEVIFLSV